MKHSGGFISELLTGLAHAGKIAGICPRETVESAEQKIFARCKLHFSAPYQTVTECDMLEWNPVAGTASSDTEFAFKPFEIKMFLIKRS